MIRKIITIDSGKCNGCGACVTACHEGAIGMKNGKAVLLRDDYCDGLGDCLPACPANAITFEEREALPYDEAAVLANMREKGVNAPACACPGSEARELPRTDLPGSGMNALPTAGCPGSGARVLPMRGVSGTAPAPRLADDSCSGSGSRLRQWPVQIKLVPVNVPYLDGADLLIAADCTAFAHGAFHPSFMEGKVTLIGCPKLDEGDYSEKFAEIIMRNDIRSVTVARMSVPCCGGIERAVREALERSGKNIPLAVFTITPEGNVLS